VSLFSTAERRQAEALVHLLHTNPFLPEWVEREREILGPAFVEAPDVYSRQASWREGHMHENLAAVCARVETLVTHARQRLGQVAAGDRELELYEDLALYQLYGLHYDELTAAAQKPWQAAEPPTRCRPRGTARRKDSSARADTPWESFQRSFAAYFPEGRPLPSHYLPERVFAIFFQMRRAFVQIYDHIIGGSRPAARLRAAVWDSVFTHDLHRYYRSLHARMRDFPTLITGPSGTGKELVARALGRSQFIPFDRRAGRFAADFGRVFFPLNLSALAPTLIESELFGHVAGAFTGAVKDREGWLEQCDPYGAVFLDEVGEVDPAIQVKLLRVLQTRGFERLGDTRPRKFEGKLLAATNRDLAAEVRAGRFREDFYYRLCADRITTPSLREQLSDRPSDLANLVLFITRETLGADADEEAGGEAEALAAEVVTWIEANLGPDYPWPGNFRELGHCVRSILIRRDYRPLAAGPGPADLASQVAAAALTAEELERRYFTLVYARLGSYQDAAERLQVDWRTVKAKVDLSLLAPKPGRTPP
jgi:transcriptional regulator with AAA-type ATPase domain